VSIEYKKKTMEWRAKWQWTVDSLWKLRASVPHPQESKFCELTVCIVRKPESSGEIIAAG
jgi:hypothetical protein